MQTLMKQPGGLPSAKYSRTAKVGLPLKRRHQPPPDWEAILGVQRRSAAIQLDTQIPQNEPRHLPDPAARMTAGELHHPQVMQPPSAICQAAGPCGGIPRM